MQTLTKSIEKAAQVLALDPEELQLWLEQYPNLTPYTQIQLLRIATKYQLDPLSDEIGVMETNEGYQSFITIDGWVKLINGHEQYAGMSLREAPIEKSMENSSDKEAPAWMECTIYRHDRILPIVVKEYLDEVKTDHPSWQQMPRRMLRHRVIQQCARLAFGIACSEIREAHLKLPTTDKSSSNEAVERPSNERNSIKGDSLTKSTQSGSLGLKHHLQEKYFLNQSSLDRL